MASSSTSVRRYDVFISFRGTDTRWGFTCSLHDALCDKGIKTFIDEEDLDKGDEISPVLLEAIKASSISIIVFSENYADSRWCLDELNHIVRCMKEDKQCVLPVFYKVEPKNIRHQKRSFDVAFSKLERRFGCDSEKLKMWRESLRATADLSGFNSADARSESELIKDIVRFVMEKLKMIPSTSSSDTNGLFGIESILQDIESALCIDSTNKETRVIGIWGMGGIGKTTLARVLFNKFYSRFSGFYFLENVRVEVTKHQSSDLQKRVFSELLKEKNLKQVTHREKDRLLHTNVLLVLDDVDNVKQLESLAIDRERFGPGSRIILTSRDSQVLRITKADKVHEIKELSLDNALRLFLLKAFGKEGEESPGQGYSALANKVVQKYAKGNPLALVVLGRHLFSRSIEEWESAMKSLDSSMNKEVQASLRVSYNGLNEEEKDIFLDIACFFKGSDKSSTQTILGYRYPGAVMGISVLIDRALITVNCIGRICMHDLIQEMGQEIVRRESNDPGERSRLWSTSDICHVFENNQGTQKIQGIRFHYRSAVPITISPRVFKEMRNLWFLEIDSLFLSSLLFPQGLDFLPSTLRYFWWYCCPLKSLPQNFNAKNLCEVAVHGDELERVWNKDLQNLELLTLNDCSNLSQLLDLSHATNLMSLNLRGCSKLNQLSNLSCSSNLKHLNLSYCRNLSQVPDLSWNINLKELVLRGCISLSQLPDLSRNSNLMDLDLSNCRNLSQLPDLSHNSNLITLDLQTCKKLKQLPDLSHASNLKWLNFMFCESINKFPLLPNPCNITNVNVIRTEIEEVPVSIECLTNVTELRFDCPRLKTLPSTICKLRSLKILSIEKSSKLEHFPEILEPMKCLEELSLDGTGIKELHPSIENLIGLKSLSLQNCQKLEKLPNTIFNMQSLVSVNINGCPKLKFITKFPSSIKSLDARGCKSLEKLSIPLVLLEEEGISVEQHFPRHLDANGFNSVERASKPWITFAEQLPLNRINIVAEFQCRVLAGKDILVTSEQKLHHVRGVDFLFPGNNISKWFCYQSEGSSVTVDPGWYNPNFIGFAACAILFCTGYRRDRVRLVWESCFTTERGDIITMPHRPFDIKYSLYNGDHVVIMQSFHVDCSDISGATQVSFKLTGVIDSFGFKTDTCGVRLLYLQDAEEFQRECQEEEESHSAKTQGWSVEKLNI